jgi:mono/diheme cytochrome c family protein
MKLSQKQLILNAVFCLALLAVIIWVFYSEYNRPWKMYQKDKIQQIYLQELGETDRCVTCHQGADKPASGNKPQPFKTHSGDYLKYHKVEKFGCVSCHDGQGAALTVDAAHGNVKNWTRPVLKGPYAQSSCGKCHFTDQGQSLNADVQGAPVLTEGRRLFNKYNCAGCHKLSANKNPDYIAPVLTSTGSKVSREWLVKWVKDPRNYLPDAKMPKFNLSDEEIGYIADYLMNNKNVIPVKAGIQTPWIPGQALNNTVQMSPKQINEGKTLATALGCLGCHSINGTGNNFAPDLSDIGNKVNAGWLVQFLRNPKAYQPKTAMPDLKIAEEDVQKISAYLMSLKKEKNPPLPLLIEGGIEGFNIEKGRKLVKDKGCTGCHEIENLPAGYDSPPLDGIGSKRVDELAFGNMTGIDKTLINWLMIKVQDPQKFATDKIVTRMPDYGFTKGQGEALVTFLLSIRNVPVPAKYVKTLSDPHNADTRGKAIVEKYNCIGCHKISDRGGTIAPDLNKEGGKSRPEWLFTFLKSPRKIRPLPMLKAGMPDFNLSDTEVNTVIEYLASISGETYPYTFEPKKVINPEDVWNGEKLYREVFACSGCHAIDGYGGEVGPDHTDLSSRLKREWIRQWLENPQAVKPDVSMPRFTFRDWEFEALTDYLMTLGKNRFVDIRIAE